MEGPRAQRQPANSSTLCPKQGAEFLLITEKHSWKGPFVPSLPVRSWHLDGNDALTSFSSTFPQTWENSAVQTINPFSLQPLTRGDCSCARCVSPGM